MSPNSFFLFQDRTCSVAEDDLELQILPPLPSAGITGEYHHRPSYLLQHLETEELANSLRKRQKKICKLQVYRLDFNTFNSSKEKQGSIQSECKEIKLTNVHLITIFCGSHKLGFNSEQLIFIWRRRRRSLQRRSNWKVSTAPFIPTERCTKTPLLYRVLLTSFKN